ncbi:cytochrome P450 [Nocardia huaxiensis]|uniref:Cytochrome P450 n=1 Tax=Nocardia huaxiensis TaxID=2755382 RepID=A0A7D6VE43_9NOCA|nr:cytochrome P450 [Nocardia huaxiensis]QLY34321.1 cytochrome P450 [Nocardia huaxiensis]UFT00074.1 cytochrome P450 [Nocardia huaxiensis]
MSRRYALRYLLEQAPPRYLLRLLAWRGDPFAKLVGSAEGMADPFRYIEEIRAGGPLWKMPFGYVTVDYEVSRHILRSTDWGVAGPDTSQLPQFLKDQIQAAPIPANPVAPPAMILMDPPDHTRMRKSVSAAFTPRAIGRLRERVESVVAELLDAMPSGGSADLITDFASQVPIAIISAMLGFPDESRAQFLHWGEEFTPLLDVGIDWKTWEHAVQATFRMDEYLDAHIERLRAEPGADILSKLITDGDLNNHELKANAILMMAAGFETTVNLIANSIVRLLEHPEQLAKLLADPALWPQAVEELLRMDTPVMNTARVPLCDTELAGVQIPKGTAVVLSLPGANRDPKMFDDPNRFDITRENAREHLSFISGPHVCLGASLARMEATHALRSLFEQFPDLRLEGTPERLQRHTLRGWSKLPVRLGDRAALGVQ